MNGRNYFSPEALKSAENQSSKSRETLIHMHPRDFLSVAKQINVPSKEKLSDIESAIESGQKLTDIPYLYFVHDAQGNAHVTGHEGRHRAMALLKRGVTSMPVSFRSTTSETKPGGAIRWGSQDKNSNDRIEGQWPKHLHGQDKMNKIPFPVQELREDVQPGYAPKEVSFMGFTTKNLHHSADAAKAFQDTIKRASSGQVRNPQDVLAALKATDAYMKLNDMHLEQDKAPDESEVNTWVKAHRAARDLLNKAGAFAHHFDYWHTHEHELQDMMGDYNPQTAGAEMAESHKQNSNVVDPKSTYNAAKDVLTYKDFLRLLLKVNDLGKGNQSDQEKPELETDENKINLGTNVFDGNVGITMGDKDHQLRRRKVKYRVD